ncbi:rho gtpase activating protein, putative [Schistosoma mansoni]|uniref:rho gtpase activating protein, putative n=1 Tax=Schistosoma mansoni TaxID=6183 RepID=UPI0001A627E1|nr:rho gtpase activating protein, putative [Schistosoma mansoni]|eukprot:XP_018644847.1 rho gtpase activating protein, putative [Schistosoma mansoni]
MSGQLSKSCTIIQDPVSNPNIEQATYDTDENSYGRCASSLYEDDVKVMEVNEKNVASSYQDSRCTRSSDGSQCSVERSKDSPMEGNGVRWRHCINNGQEMYINEATNEKWVPATDQYGKTYYYELNTRHSVWALEDLETSVTEAPNLSDSLNNYLDINGLNPSKEGLNCSVFEDENNCSYVDQYPSVSRMSSISKVNRRTMSQSKASHRSSHIPSEVCSTQVINRPFSLVSLDDQDQGAGGRFQIKNLSKEYISGPSENKLTHFERRGAVIRTMLIENDKRVSKKWIPGVLHLSGPLLFLYKDNKPSLPFNIREVKVSEASGEQTSRKNVLKIECETAGKLNVHLVQIPAIDYESWKAAIRYAKDLLNEDHGVTLGRSLTRYESVFASTIIQICENEDSDVPNFIVRAIRAIEARGLDHIGIYRSSGNGATIQKLRCAVNQYNYSLNSEKWSLEVLTGALKLFFRELKEPLITFKVYPEVDQLLGDNDLAPDIKVIKMRELINSMPVPHINTSRIFFHHLYRVMQLSSINQMHSYNLAIVFGPSLIWPEVESVAYRALKSVQVPCIEYLLTHVEEIFGPVTPPPVIS